MSMSSAFSRSSSSTVFDFKPSAFHCMILRESRVDVGWASDISMIGAAGLAKLGFTGLLQLWQVQDVAEPALMAFMVSLLRLVQHWWKCFLHVSQMIADGRFLGGISRFLWFDPGQMALVTPGGGGATDFEQFGHMKEVFLNLPLMLRP